MTSTISIPRAKIKSLLPLFILILIFFLPVIGAKWLYNSGQFWWKKSTNRGDLLTPPLAFENLNFISGPKAGALHGKWLMFYFAPNDCNELCLKNVYLMRQIRIATNESNERILRLLITNQPLNTATAKTIEHDFKQTLLAQVNPLEFSKFISTQPAKSVALSQGYLYLADPLGNVILSYPPTTQGDELFADLKRLLKVSQIG